MQSFDTGKEFDSRFKGSIGMLWGVLAFSYAARFWKWHEANIGAGFFTIFAGFGLLVGLIAFLPGLWNFLAWLRLEVIGVKWGHSADGSGPWRVSSRRTDGSALYEMKTFADRRAAELSNALIWEKWWPLSQIATVGALVAALVAFQFSDLLGWIVVLAAVGPLVVLTANFAIYIVAYQKGAQYITGSKVMDAAPVQPDAGEVEKQKVHGDARVATEDETRAAAAGSVQRSSVHDREF